ncbi:MAG: division/cell wall cluster transcriptional repressor MraZ [Candidatus Marinimicrobia bacterium]|nr:division/cell wall cluster transcriptional repressor MraZ [Candidatus Neomarinimicrobiota bacterium]MBT4794879.1 division/cell wall cluster transcriptional repressor MraZ [Candidatus Neomarinimicrobiota bacterium]MBT5999664.1 division/cell wall cluster transcriptional repressor MraZ [Candidatus Neomarinimicrobiota bacterium]
MAMTLTDNTFSGEYSYSIDSKGRVNIPAKFRQALSVENENTFVITRGMDPCVWVYPLTEWKFIETELRELSSLASLNRTFIRNTTRYATPVTFDKQGRIQITSSLIEFAGLKKTSLIIGMINKIEVWNPETLKKTEKKNLEIDSTEYDTLAEKIIL